MSLTLFLLRHAKTQPAASGEQDFDRPLYKEGVTQSIRLGQHLAQQKIKPDHIISSPARRAIDTLLNVVQALDINQNEVQFEESVYTGETDQLLELIQATNHQHKSLLLTGHNPAITSLASYLVRGFAESMDPCDLVHIELDSVTEWLAISKHSGLLKNIIHSSSL